MAESRGGDRRNKGVEGEGRRECDVVVCSPFRHDEYVFNLWLSGYTAQQTAERRKAKGWKGDDRARPSAHIVLQDTVDQFRTYSLMEHYLKKPQFLVDQPLFYMRRRVRSQILSSYYRLDDLVVRAIIGRKLVKGKGLSDIVERSGQRQKLCRIQYHNLVRIYKKVSLNATDTPLHTIVCETFLLETELATKYVETLFLCHHRFLCNKKRLKHIPMSDYASAARVLMSCWIDGDRDATTFRIHKGFRDDIRDLKVTVVSNRDLMDAYKHEVMKSIRAHEAFTGVALGPKSPLDKKCPLVLKSLFSLAAGIGASREFRDFFEDLVERVVVPLKKAAVTSAQVEPLFDCVTESFTDSVLAQASNVSTHVASSCARWHDSWNRFLQGVAGVTACIYQHIRANK